MDIYLHVRVLLSMILGLSMAQLLGGISRIVQHPKRYAVYWVHLVWSLFLFLYLIHFWWWEFRLAKIAEWTYPIYFFVAVYATLLYLICSLFFPVQIDDYDGFKNYFYFRRKWLFGFMAAVFVFDWVDTMIKGAEYHARLGVIGDLRIVVFVALCLLATRIKNEIFHAVFACFAVVFEVGYISRMYLTLS